MQRFQAKDLEQTHLVQALPLLQLGCDATEAADWATLIYRQFLGGLHYSTDTGLVVAEDGRGYVAGLFAYRVVPDLPAYLIFDCQKFVVPDTIGRRWAFNLLIDEAEGRARHMDCTHLRVSLPSVREPSGRDTCSMQRRLSTDGFRFEGAQYQKALNRTPAV